ncbi:uncharacterized protein E0L32_010211 [Thyridium curvatum]|uniref:WSC domain-containing protein n=1 Tax=Thyridium curvatum TaxID=1093900 RepID=A0A507ANY7_9PEZI|nr:uncharacterized protein E0L32_010211 [Thyridium curvatum]TPX08144.1 hypothetical protein E0L32_010211 [Thyridium curvatum]
MISSTFITLATAASLLISGVQAQGTYQGCVGVSSTFDDTYPLTPNGPQACANYCTAKGYNYIALSAQFCSCSKAAPTVSQKYADSACAFACDADASQSCGGMDPNTFEFIYSVWLYGSGAPIQAPASSAAGPASSAAAPVASTGNAAAAPNTATTSALPTTTSTLIAAPGPVDTTTTAPVIPVSSAGASADPAVVNGPNNSDIPPFTTVTDSLFTTSTVPCISSAFTQIVAVTTTVPCSDGTMETAVANVPTIIYYDPAYSTVRTVIDQTTTRYVLVPVTAFVTATASGSGTFLNAPSSVANAPISVINGPISVANSTTAANATTATSTAGATGSTFVVTAGADKSAFGGLNALALVIAAIAGFALS